MHQLEANSVQYTPRNAHHQTQPMEAPAAASSSEESGPGTARVLDLDVDHCRGPEERPHALSGTHVHALAVETDAACRSACTTPSMVDSATSSSSPLSIADFSQAPRSCNLDNMTTSPEPNALTSAGIPPADIAPTLADGRDGDHCLGVESSSKSEDVHWSGWLLAFALSGVLFIDVLTYSFPIPFLPQVLDAQGYSALDISLVMSTFFFCSIATLIANTYIATCHGLQQQQQLSDSRQTQLYHRRTVCILIALLFNSCSTLFSGLFPTYTIFLIARALQGAASGLSWIFSLSMVADLFPKRVRGVAVSIVFAGNTLGEVAGPVAGGSLYTSLGTSGAFFVVSAVGFSFSAFFAVASILHELSAKAIAENNAHGDAVQWAAVSTVRATPAVAAEELIEHSGSEQTEHSGSKQTEHSGSKQREHSVSKLASVPVAAPPPVRTYTAPSSPSERSVGHRASGTWERKFDFGPSDSSDDRRVLSRCEEAYARLADLSALSPLDSRGAQTHSCTHTAIDGAQTHSCTCTAIDGAQSHSSMCTAIDGAQTHACTHTALDGPHVHCRPAAVDSPSRDAELPFPSSPPPHATAAVAVAVAVAVARPRRTIPARVPLPRRLTVMNFFTDRSSPFADRFILSLSACVGIVAIVRTCIDLIIPLFSSHQLGLSELIVGLLFGSQALGE